MAIIADEKWLPSDSIILENNADAAIKVKKKCSCGSWTRRR